MKLFARYSRINLLAVSVVFVLAGVAYFFVLQFVLIGQVDDDLEVEEDEVRTYTAKYDRMPEIIPVKDQYIKYSIDYGPSQPRTFNTIHNPDSSEDKQHLREIVFVTRAGSGQYRVSISKSLQGTDDLLQLIVTVTLVTIACMIIVSLLINRFVLRKLWRPFYDSLEKVQDFKLGTSELQFRPTKTDEFTLMNRTLEEAMVRADREYNYLKTFTENASHELQTPLAIIQSKLEVLIQDEQLSEANSRVVQSAFESLQRLSKLNQGLLLLARIENGQYAQTEEIDFGERITQKLEQLSELIVSKSLLIERTTSAAKIAMNPLLAEILLNNLFSNAIKYTPEGGTIGINTTSAKLEVRNSGTQPLEESRLFRRFANRGLEGEGVGLGLAIVYEVAGFSGFTVTYQFLNGYHRFRIDFASRKSPEL